jgi:hypothetical protein
MESTPLAVGAQAASQLLDSGHIVVTVFVVHTAILICVIIFVLRLWREERKETVRLNNIIVDMVGKMIEAMKDSREQVETLTKVLLHGNNK